MSATFSSIRRVAVLMGGPSSEREVSLRTGAAVAGALRTLGYDVVEVDVTAREVVLPEGIDFVFLSLHGTFGEDGTVQAMLEARGVPYTGCGVAASRLAFDKEASKELFRAAGIPTPAGHCVLRGGSLPEPMEMPVVVKPSKQGSTVGMSFVFEEKDLEPALRKAWEFDEHVLVEQFIKGREFTVGILGKEALPPVEIVPKSGFYDYDNKYTAGATDYYCPARIDEETTLRIQRAALLAHRVLCCQVYSRVDVMLDEKGRPFVLEVNTIPGMTATSLLPKAAAAAGIDFPGLCGRILELSAAAAAHAQDGKGKETL
ncbi:D-alanine-D-alanine ligase [Verrucomicrobium sp. GAS474]|uniref:D-alanine--D-alanine ligase n=1 Tax=Verrucomicrobium sp. GAS474 TaxID=1882831 RepID=UPI00087C49EB|nr:D-alanine--D-alanine ligase [Verrucomicrobium sp. GAS474]SDU28734.1 D-alanine-D-alanine ligase [Verrucomicrobium sp. GAS474]